MTLHMTPDTRASKNCKRADTRLRKIFENLYFLRQNRKTGIFMMLAEFDNITRVLHVYGILSPFLCAKLSVGKLCLRKRFNF